MWRFLLILICLTLPKQSEARYINAQYFSFSELKELSQDHKLRPALEKKLDHITNKPIFISNKDSFKTRLATVANRKAISVSHWNLERGYKLKELDQALNSSKQYLKVNSNEDLDEKKVLEEIQILKDTDIFTLNEVDIGMHRTNYKNTLDIFTQITHSSQAIFAPEFFEIDPKYLGLKNLDKNKYKGFHGNAIVSKFPIVKTKIIELPECYDWFAEELKKIALLEKIKRSFSKRVFKTPIITELRRGHRNALLAEIDIPNSKENLTVVVTHFENRCRPTCRKKQLKHLLKALKHIKTPLVLTGDFNNSEVSSEPTSFVNVVTRTLGDWQNLSRAFATYFNPISYIINPAFLAFNTIRKSHDPTAFGLPILLRNKTADLFWKLINFEFDDKNMFDFSGHRELSYKKKDGNLANSNQRTIKGFASTFRLARNILLHFRFDWIFVKSMRINGCQDNEDDFEDIKPHCKRFIPAFGRNLRALNESHNKEYSKEVKKNIYRDFALDRLSDHDPINCKILI